MTAAEDRPPVEGAIGRGPGEDGAPGENGAPGGPGAPPGGSATDGPFRLTAPDGTTYASPVPGTLGGHRRSRIYGRLDCRTALRAIERGGYVRHRVFFADEPAARAAGHRPCAVCLPDAYAAWRRGA